MVSKLTKMPAGNEAQKLLKPVAQVATNNANETSIRIQVVFTGASSFVPSGSSEPRSGGLSPEGSSA